MDGMEEFAENMKAHDGRLAVFLDFLRLQRGRTARGVATQVTAFMAQKMIRKGMPASEIARELGISPRRVYQIQKKMK